MWMRFGVAPRRTGMSTADFQAYWKDRHAPVVLGMPGLTLYHQNHAVLHQGEPLLPWPGFDACAQFGADTPAGFDQAFSSAHYRDAVTPDARQFVDTSRGGFVLCGPQPADAVVQGGLDAPLGGERVRLLSFLRAAPQVPAAGMADALQALELPAQALGRAVWHASAAGQQSSMFDAIEILCFPDPEAALRHVLGGASRLRMEPLAGAIRGTERLIARVAVVL